MKLLKALIHEILIPISLDLKPQTSHKVLIKLINFSSYEIRIIYEELFAIPKCFEEYDWKKANQRCIMTVLGTDLEAIEVPIYPLDI